VPRGFLTFLSFDPRDVVVADPGERTGDVGRPPYFQTKVRPEGLKKNFFETVPLPPPYLRVWMTAPLPLISRSGSGSGELWFNIRILKEVESPTISRAKEELSNKVIKTQSVRF